MNYTKKEVLIIDQISITNHLPEIGIDQVRKEIIEGLCSENKHISSKFFYDERGSKLFEEITQLEEYYPTRTEISILKHIAPHLMRNLKNVDIVELGSGDCGKISILLDAVAKENMQSLHYLPIDVSQSALTNSANQLVERYPDLVVSCQVADFMNQMDKIPHDAKRLFCFFGSTIGNFDREEANKFLQNLSHAMLPGDQLLIGFDMIKDEKVLHAAYNDSLGITEAFNLNILNSVNHLIESNFDLNSFEHKAFFNKQQARIEMHLLATEDVVLDSPYFSESITISKGQGIHTENSHKYSKSDIQKFAEISGLNIKEVFSDSNNWFSLVYFEK